MVELPQGVKVLASWSSRGGKYNVVAYRHSDGTYGFRTESSGGSGYSTESEVLKRAELEASFMPSKMVRH